MPPSRRAVLTGLCGLASGCGAAATPVAQAPPALRPPAVVAPPVPPPPPPEAVDAETLIASRSGQSFDAFLRDLRADARRAGISQSTVDRALGGLRPNARVIQLDRRQVEFTISWDQYRDRQVSPTRVENGRRVRAEEQALLAQVEARYGVPGPICVAIWGVETNYGGNTGGYNVVEALATLAWEGRRAAFFRAELLAALRILDAGNTTPDRMRGSYAGAMGQPQSMPTSFERLAVDFDGDGRRDIWDSRADALGSIGNYLARSGWRAGEIWGREALLPPRFDTTTADVRNTRPLREWAAMGVRRADGGELPRLDLPAAIVLPAGPLNPSPAYVVYPNFNAIRRYNPSNFYALSVGLLADRVA